jgi:hypothetical protein
MPSCITSPCCADMYLLPSCPRTLKDFATKCTAHTSRRIARKRSLREYSMRNAADAQIATTSKILPTRKMLIVDKTMPVRGFMSRIELKYRHYRTSLLLNQRNEHGVAGVAYVSGHAIHPSKSGSSYCGIPNDNGWRRRGSVNRYPA